MKKKIVYTDAPKDVMESLLTAKRIVDDLPPPEKLVFRQPKEKITITLNKRSVDFFKQYAKQHNIKYQTMINELLDIYAQNHNKQNAMR